MRRPLLRPSERIVLASSAEELRDLLLPPLKSPLLLLDPTAAEKSERSQVTVPGERQREQHSLGSAGPSPAVAPALRY